MRILILSNFYPPYELGGQGRSCQQIVEGLRARGHEVLVLTSMHGVDNTPTDVDGVYRWLYLEMDFVPWRQVFNFFLHRKGRERKNLARFELLLEQEEPELIFIWGLWNLPRSLAARAEERFPGTVVYRFAEYWPTLPSQHEMYWQAKGRTWFSQIPKTALGWAARLLISLDNPPAPLKFERAICVSASTRDILVDAGIPVEHARIIHTGIDADKFMGDVSISFPKHRSSSLSLLYAGRLHPDKGLDTAIESMALLVSDGEKRAKLNLAGSGETAYLKHLIELVDRYELQDHVEFLGRISPDKIPALMQDCDVLLLPSIWQEPFARVVLEGMCVGMVILATPTGGTKEIIRDGLNGLLFKPGDAHSLAEQIRHLIEDPELCDELAHTGWDMVREHYSIRRMLDAYEDYLSDTLTESEVISEIPTEIEPVRS